jgi:ethanolamine utilization protein EutA
MLSVGIDVGTTTTQLIFSRLILGGGIASSSQSPLSLLRSASIVDKEVIYRSQIYFTPLKGPDEIDAVALEQIFLQE